MSDEFNPSEIQRNWILSVLSHIVDEAIATKPASMTQQAAVEILIQDRQDRNILNAKEANWLRTFLWGRDGIYNQTVS